MLVGVGVGGGLSLIVAACFLSIVSMQIIERGD